jgi:hypothetical protein
MKKFIWILAIPILLLPLLLSGCWGSYGDGFNAGLKACNRITSDQITRNYNLGFEDGSNTAWEAIDRKCCDVCIQYPTEEQVMAFLASDNTSETLYLENVFDCKDFSYEVNRNAWEKGIPCYVTVIDWEGTKQSHVIVAFPIQGQEELLFIEPQDDNEIIGLEVGQQPMLYEGGKWLFYEGIVKRIRVYQ